MEKALNFIEDDILERLTAGYHGWNLRFGGLVQGSGFALGPEYTLDSNFSPATCELGAQISTKLYQKYFMGWAMPKLAQDIFPSTSMRRTGTTHRSTISAQAPGRRRATDRLPA